MGRSVCIAGIFLIGLFCLTVDAAERLRLAGRTRREAEQDIDMAAAAVILQSYLDEQRRQS